MPFSLKRTVNSFQTHKQLKKFLVNKEHGVCPQLQPTEPIRLRQNDESLLNKRKNSPMLFTYFSAGVITLLQDTNWTLF